MDTSPLDVRPASRPLRQRSYTCRVLWHLSHDAVALSGFALVLFITLSAVFAVQLAPYPPSQMDLSATYQGPSSQHLFGTDELGRDMLSRIIYGARVTLRVSLGSILVSLPLGLALGLAAGYVGGWLDNLICRAMDIMFAFPALLLALLIVAVLGPELRNVIVALAVISVPRFGRVIRGSVLSVKTATYVEAARAIGCGHLRVVTRHILPNVLSPVIVQATVTMATAVLAEASLSFLGLGVQPPTPAWGSMLNAGKIFMEQNPHLTIFPGLAIAVTVLGFNFLGDGLRDAMDPYLRR